MNQKQRPTASLVGCLGLTVIYCGAVGFIALTLSLVAAATKLLLKFLGVL